MLFDPDGGNAPNDDGAIDALKGQYNPSIGACPLCIGEPDNINAPVGGT